MEALIARLTSVNGPSMYRRAILREQAILPPLCGMPRIIRSFIGI